MAKCATDSRYKCGPTNTNPDDTFEVGWQIVECDKFDCKDHIRNDSDYMGFPGAIGFTEPEIRVFRDETAQLYIRDGGGMFHKGSGFFMPMNESINKPRANTPDFNRNKN